MIKGKGLLSLLILSVVVCMGVQAQDAGDLALIPYPRKVERLSGKYMLKFPQVLYASSHFAEELKELGKLISGANGQTFKVTQQEGGANIKLIYDTSLAGDERYSLRITSREIVVRAKSAAGAFYAVETIRQLLPASLEKGVRPANVVLPALTIEDAPTYAWRGMMLDVSRHFFSISYLRKFIDRMALYKMNRLHLHLTDDQGWRVEIKQYPALTQAGAWRSFDHNDSACMQLSKENPDFAIDAEHIVHRNGKTLYGGFYTQEQLKGLVRYAAAKHVDIIPEIDMPGHFMAAINSYPFLTCNGRNQWGELFTTPICPCNEDIYTFTQNVVGELIDIFPSQYIHLGGDEVDRSSWAVSDACKALMEKEGIKSTAELQSYFMRRMEKFVHSKGRTMIGWDEILEGGISPTALIMYWRTWVPKAPVEAVKNGNSVVMSPGEPLYFDYPADPYSIRNVYHFDPVPAVIKSIKADAILGAQANMWSERIPSTKRADYMTMPRMTALAELLWTNDTSQYASYLQRLSLQYPRMEAMKVNYRLPDITGLLNDYVFVDADTLRIVTPASGLTVRYMMDGGLPAVTSPILPQGLVIRKSGRVRLAAFTSGGIRGDVYDLNFHQQPMSSAVTVADTKPGLAVDYLKGRFSATASMKKAPVDSSFSVERIMVPASVNAASFGLVYKGYIDVPADGIYSFYLTCDDGGVLYIADKMVVDNDGNHSARERSGQVALKRGAHFFQLDFIEGGGGFKLGLKYSFGGSEPRDVPAEWFKMKAQ